MSNSSIRAMEMIQIPSVLTSCNDNNASGSFAQFLRLNDKDGLSFLLKRQCVLEFDRETHHALQVTDNDTFQHLLNRILSSDPEVKKDNIVMLLRITLGGNDKELAEQVISCLPAADTKHYINMPFYESKDEKAPVPLLVASAINGYRDWVELCVNNGAAINQLTKDSYAGDITAMDCAVSECIGCQTDELLEGVRVVGYLEAHGGICTGDHRTVLESLKELYKVVPCKDQSCNHTCKRCDDEVRNNNRSSCCYREVVLRNRNPLKKLWIQTKLQALYQMK